LVDNGVYLSFNLTFEKQGSVDILIHALHDLVVKREDGACEFTDFLLIRPDRALLFAAPDGGQPA
jgi:hypothetical protein